MGMPASEDQEGIVNGEDTAPFGRLPAARLGSNRIARVRGRRARPARALRFPPPTTAYTTGPLAPRQFARGDTVRRRGEAAAHGQGRPWRWDVAQYGTPSDTPRRPPRPVTDRNLSANRPSASELPHAAFSRHSVPALAITALSPQAVPTYGSPENADPAATKLSGASSRSR